MQDVISGLLLAADIYISESVDEKMCSILPLIIKPFEMTLLSCSVRV